MFRAAPAARQAVVLVAGALLLQVAAWCAESSANDREPGVPRSPGDALRGMGIVMSRSQGLCVLCHPAPGPGAHASGTLAPDLAGVGSRLDEKALRQRLTEPEAFNPDTIMPSYARTEGLVRVAAQRKGKPLLSEAQIDDVLAYLLSLK